MITKTVETQLSHSVTPSLIDPTALGTSTALQSASPASPVWADSAHPAQTSQPPEPSKPRHFSAATPDNQDAMLDSRIESIARRQRAHSFINSITPEQARQVHTIIQECEHIHDAHARITAPPPEGLGLTVSAITLRRLRNHWRALDEVHFTRDMLDIITDMEVDSELTQPARIQNAICHFLHEKAFDLARTVPGSEVMKELISNIEKLTTLDLKRQKLQLERDRILQRPPRTIPASTQHHRVDLNIVPPPRPQGPNAVVQSEPEPPSTPLLQS